MAMPSPGTISAIKELGTVFVKWITSFFNRRRMYFVSDDREMFWNGGATYGEIPRMQVHGAWTVTSTASHPISILKAYLHRRHARRVSQFPYVRLSQRTLALMCRLDADRKGSPTGRLQTMFFVPEPQEDREALKATIVFVDNLAKRHKVKAVFKWRGPGQNTTYFD